MTHSHGIDIAAVDNGCFSEIQTVMMDTFEQALSCKMMRGDVDPNVRIREIGACHCGQFEALAFAYDFGPGGWLCAYCMEDVDGDTGR